MTSADPIVVTSLRCCGSPTFSVVGVVLLQANSKEEIHVKAVSTQQTSSREIPGGGVLYQLNLDT